MARYGQDFKNKALAKLLPPESAPLDQVAAEVGVSACTLERWRSDALSQPRSDSKVWSAAARCDALLTTAAMYETAKSAWCSANGVLLHDLQLWRQTAGQSVADPQDQQASPSQTAQDRRSIKELERDLRRKEKALAETAALLVLSKKLGTIFQKDRDEEE